MANKKTLIRALEDLIVESPRNKLKILIVAAEAAPYVTVGGFSSVIGYLSKELVKIGYDVRIFMPKFGLINEDAYKMDMVIEGLKVPTDDEGDPYLICNVKKHESEKNGVTAYFLENQEYYEVRANVYDYADDATRWALLSRGVLEFIKKGGFVPDIIHTNDWHTGLVSNYLETAYKKDPVLSKIATVFTIHNLSFQGQYIDLYNFSELDFDDGKSSISPFFDERLKKLNCMKRGILYSDVVNTVSKTYAKEILTPDFGNGLDRLLLEVKEKLFGIVNGIDYTEFDPATDNLIEQNYDIRSLDLRVKNKAALQKEFDLPIRSDVPVLGFVGRLDNMKGVGMMVNVLWHIIKNFDVQFVQVGGGDTGLTEDLHRLRNEYPDKVGIYPYPNFTLPRLMFSGCDMILYPSRFEPCGIVQIEAMRYGAIPIVREVGGLADTVEKFDISTGKGTGFAFKDFNEFSLYGEIVRGLETYKNKNAWKMLQKNALKADFSWKYSAKEYEKLYEIALSFKSKGAKTVRS